MLTQQQQQLPHNRNPLQGHFLCWIADVCAVGMFELQICHFQNPHGLLQTGDCCDLQTSGGQRCSARDQCDTYFQACLKEYQARVAPTGSCTFGSGSTGVLGGNSQSLRHRGYDGGGEDGTNGNIVIPFKYAWPVSTGGCPRLPFITDSVPNFYEQDF
uniref:Notch ligand N-terminal domain-containing protein n=1 Tax=Nothobranchius furzeri TaxID=105023 RepID=A0A8C6PL96_NOTFU